MFCGQETIAVHHDNGTDLHRLRCRSWNCATCKHDRLRALRRLAAAGEPSTLITLTINPDAYDSPEQAAQQLVISWRRILQRAKREGLAERIEYIAVFEETRRGWPHVHILARCPFLPQRWLSACHEKYADSPIVDIRRVYNRRHASRYIAKYVSKGPARYEGCKRYWRSRGYDLDATPNDDEAEPMRAMAYRLGAPLETVSNWYTLNGWNVEHRSVHFHRCTYQPGAEHADRTHLLIMTSRAPPTPCRGPRE